MVLRERFEVVEIEGDEYQAVEQDSGLCTGCISYDSECIQLCNNPLTECRGDDRPDGTSVIWVKLEKEQPVSKPDTIKEIRAKTATLQNEIYKLIEAFEGDTGMVLHRVDITRHSQIGGKSVLALPELDVRLN